MAAMGAARHRGAGGKGGGLTRLQRILNFVRSAFFWIFTDRASFRRAFCRKSRMSLISFGMLYMVWVVEEGRRGVTRGGVGKEKA